jgi:hypothetical protein
MYRAHSNRTEDLPELPDCQFDAQLIRDVASNLLSFLRTNATKEGHTYWLFKYVHAFFCHTL